MRSTVVAISSKRFQKCVWDSDLATNISCHKHICYYINVKEKFNKILKYEKSKLTSFNV